MSNHINIDKRLKERISNVILGTGSYENVKTGNTVSITGDGGTAWNYYGNSYKKLAPRLFTYIPYAEKLEKIDYLLKNNKIDIEEYKRLKYLIEEEYIESYYESRLKNLNIEELINTLENKFGDHIIFLCHEPIDSFCHRRELASYIELKTGLYIPEISTDEKGNIKKLVPIDYKERLIKYMYKR